MSTEVVYARLPSQVKVAVTAHAARLGMTQTSALVDLLNRGLESTSNAQSVAELERQSEEARAAGARKDIALQEVELRLRAAEQRERTLLSAHQGLSRRLEQVIGTCAKCSQRVSGYDLLVTGHCANCSTGLAALIGEAASAKGGLNQQELIALFGAVGVVLALAYLQARPNA